MLYIILPGIRLFPKRCNHSLDVAKVVRAEGKFKIEDAKMGGITLAALIFKGR